MSLKIISVDGTEPVSLEEARQQCYIYSPDPVNDALLSRFIRTARLSAEVYLWMAIVKQTFKQTFSEFEDQLKLHRAPVISVQSVQYLKNGEYVVMDESDYYVDSDNGIIEFTGSIPEADERTNAVKVIYKAGIPDSERLLIDDIRTAILMHVKMMFDNRDAVLVSHGALNVIEPPLSYKWLLTPHSKRTFV